MHSGFPQTLPAPGGRPLTGSRLCPCACTAQSLSASPTSRLPALCPSAITSDTRGAPPGSPCAALASSSPSPPPARGRALPPVMSRPEPESEALDAELVVTPPGCTHLSSFKVDNWKQNLRAIYQCFVWCGTAEARKRKVSPIPPPPPETAGRAGSQSRDTRRGSESGVVSGPNWGRKGKGREDSLASGGLSWLCAPMGWGIRVLFSFLSHSPPPFLSPLPPPQSLPYAGLCCAAPGVRVGRGQGLGRVSAESRQSVLMRGGGVQFCEGILSFRFASEAWCGGGQSLRRFRAGPLGGILQAWEGSGSRMRALRKK